MKFETLKSYMENKNLREKFSISIGAVIFFCFAAFTLYLAFDQNVQNKKILRENSERYAELLVLSNREHVWNFNQDGLEDTCRAFYAIPDIASIRISDNNGNVLVSLDGRKVRWRENPVRKDIYVNNNKIGELELVVARDEYNRKLLSIVLKLLGLFTLVSLITFFSVRAISKRVLRPLNEMMAAVDRITHGDMSKTIDLHSNDEIGRLAGSFNDMMFRVRESISSIKSIIEFMPSIIIQLDPYGNILECNRLAEAFMGISLDNAKGRNLNSLKPEISVYLMNAAGSIKSGRPFTLYRIRLHDYEDMYFNMFIFPLNLEHSESIVLRIDDITELEKKDVHIRQSQKLESIGLLASGVAHDFNNILGGILGTSSLLRYKIAKKTVDNVQDFSRELEIIEKSCENGAAIVAQLLNLSRNESDVEFHPADLNELIRQIGKICINSMDKSIQITVTEYSEPATAMINGSQIQQTLLNLCINASHAMTIMKKSGDPHGGHLDIGIEKIRSDLYFMNTHPGSGEGMYWRIYVKDTGVGMDNSTLSRIYDPFFTTKTNTSVKGSGLGLSIAYSIIRSHRGFIDVYSEPGKGTAFTIYIPAYEGAIADTGSSPSADVIKGGGTVLVIDDEELIRAYTKSMLIECGYDVITGNDGNEAVDLYSANAGRISAVILDMVMPVKSGYEAMAELKKIDPDVKILMTSGLYSKNIIDETMKAGAVDFIEKPYTIETLSKKLHKVINK